MSRVHTTVTLLAVLALVFLVSAQVARGQAQPLDEDWQRQRLFNPTASDLEAERKGRVFIYDGLLDVDVERALNEQFDRIESMMFVGTVVTEESGEPATDEESGLLLTEDDGC